MEIEELIKDPENAEVYYCPRRNTNNCHCLEEFVMKHSWINEHLGTPEDALKLLKSLRSEALELSKERCQTNDIKIMNGDDGRSNSRGCRKRKSKKYLQYILETRRKLRSHGICEVSAKKILKYSSNIIYKKLKYDYEHRNDLIADETRQLMPNKKLIPIEELMEMRCCKNKCTDKLKTDLIFYSKMRSDVTISHNIKRKAITRLLMTSSGEIKNCNKFIVLLLGVNRKTIYSVKNALGLGSKGVKKQEFEQSDETPAAYTQKLETNMQVQTSNNHHQTTNADKNFHQVNHIPQDMGQSSVSFQDAEVQTTQAQQMFYQWESFAETSPKDYSLFEPEQFQTTDLMNQNFSLQVCPNVANVSHQFYIPHELVASASSNLNNNYIGYNEQNFGNNRLPTYENNLPPQQYISVNPINQYMVNDFSYQYLPTYPANVNRMYTINPSPLLYWNGMLVTTHTPSSFG